MKNKPRDEWCVRSCLCVDHCRNLPSSLGADGSAAAPNSCHFICRGGLWRVTRSLPCFRAPWSLPSDFWAGLIYIGLETSVALAAGSSYARGTPINFLVELIKEIGEEGTVYQLSIGGKSQAKSELKCAKQGVGIQKGARSSFSFWAKFRLQTEEENKPRDGRVMAGDSTFWKERKMEWFIPSWEKWRSATFHEMWGEKTAFGGGFSWTIYLHQCFSAAPIIYHQ